MKVLNFGSLNIDYVYSVDHFVKKGETLASNHMSVFSGGKGLNQSIALSRAGVFVYHAGMIGKDGMFLLELLKEEQINTELIKIAETSTGHAIIQKNQEGDNCILLYGGANQCISKEYVDEVLSQFEKGDYLILQNEMNELGYIVKKAHEKGMFICLNLSPMNEIIKALPLEQIDLFFLNEIEACQLLGETLDNHSLVKKLKQKFPIVKFVLTLGEQGAVYFDSRHEIWHPANKVEVVDTTAAGDTFTGYFLAAMLNGCSIEECMKQATDAASITITRLGAAPSIPTKDELLNFRN